MARPADGRVQLSTSTQLNERRPTTAPQPAFGRDGRPPRPTERDYAVDLVPTTRRRHITGSTALNIPASYRLGGDWHEHSVFAPRGETDRARPDDRADARPPPRPPRSMGPARRPERARQARTPGRRESEQGLGCNPRARSGRSGVEAGDQMDRVRARPPAVRPDGARTTAAAPGPVGPPALVGVEAASGDDASGAGTVGPVAEAVDTMRLNPSHGAQIRPVQRDLPRGSPQPPEPAAAQHGR